MVVIIIVVGIPLLRAPLPSLWWWAHRCVALTVVVVGVVPDY